MLTSRPTHGGGAPFGIDLDAGIARITVPRPAEPVAPPEPPSADTTTSGAPREVESAVEADEPGA